jgi:hypothetical protein
MKITTKPLPVKYQNLLKRVDVDITQLKYRTCGKSFEAINTPDWSLIISRKNENTIGICLWCNPLKYVEFSQEFDFIDKTYLKTIQKLSSKYFAKFN